MHAGKNAFHMYLQMDRKKNEFELIEKFNPILKLYSKHEIEKYNRRTKYQYQNRLFQKIQKEM